MAIRRAATAMRIYRNSMFAIVLFVTAHTQNGTPLLVSTNENGPPGHVLRDLSFRQGFIRCLCSNTHRPQHHSIYFGALCRRPTARQRTEQVFGREYSGAGS
jgi:hypothetical protein